MFPRYQINRIFLGESKLGTAIGEAGAQSFECF